jgi:hypothetical protein
MEILTWEIINKLSKEHLLLSDEIKIFLNILNILN